MPSGWFVGWTRESSESESQPLSVVGESFHPEPEEVT